MAGCKCYLQWQGMPTVETRRADKTTRNAGDSDTKCRKRTATVCDTGIQTTRDAMAEMSF